MKESNPVLSIYNAFKKYTGEGPNPTLIRDVYDTICRQYESRSDDEIFLKKVATVVLISVFGYRDDLQEIADKDHSYPFLKRTSKRNYL